MNTHFSWEVLKLKKYGTLGSHSNIVYSINWKCTGISTVGSETKTASQDGWVSISTSVSDPIDYSSLNSSTVVGWAKDSLTSVGVNGYENIVTDLLNSDSYESTPPWS